MLRNDERRQNPKIEIEKRITEAFLVFDTQANRQADVREIGTIVRSLGLVPTEAEVRTSKQKGSFSEMLR